MVPKKPVVTNRAGRAAAIKVGLTAYEAMRRPLPGIALASHRDAFVRQLVDSARRTDYVRVMLQRDVSPLRADPVNSGFDPVLAAIHFLRHGEFEEACWLTFLGVQFGKHMTDGWALCRAVYGRLDAGPTSTWAASSADVNDLCTWIEAHAEQIKVGPPRRRFGNHRKYESLATTGNRGTPTTIRTYVDWVGSAGGHSSLLNNATSVAAGDKYKAFDALYRAMDKVASFGRLAKFDYLSMLGKLGAAPIAAGSTYVRDSTGPLKGASLLFGGSSSSPPAASVMDVWLRELAEDLGVTMQDMEDAVCNWQKSPHKYTAFRG